VPPSGIARTWDVENPAAANVVFLPPLALGRHVMLPRLSEAEYRQVLARDAFRYFPTDRSPRVVGALKLPTRQSSPVPIFATVCFGAIGRCRSDSNRGSGMRDRVARLCVRVVGRRSDEHVAIARTIEIRDNRVPGRCNRDSFMSTEHDRK